MVSRLGAGKSQVAVLSADGTSDLEALVALQDTAVDRFLARAPEYRESVTAFGELFRGFRRMGAMALNEYNMRLASRAKIAHPGSVIRTYIQFDAVCNEHDDGGRRPATVIVPLEALRGYIPVEDKNFVDMDSAEVKEGVRRYLNENRLAFSNRVLSHLDEVIGAEGSNLNKVFCGEHWVDFSPTMTLRMVTDSVSNAQKRDVEAAVVEELGDKLMKLQIIQRRKGLKNDLRAILNVGESGYPDLYSVFEHTRFFLTVLKDAAATAKPEGLTALRFFDSEDNRSRSFAKQAQLQQRTIKALEEVVARHINSPYEVFVYGVKSPESFATKAILARLHPVIKAGFEDGTLNAYLRWRGLPGLEEVHKSDLRDLFRMAWIVHGDSVTYDIRGEYLPSVPSKELKAQGMVYDRFFRFAEIPVEFRLNGVKNGRHSTNNSDESVDAAWRSLGTVETSDGVTINLESKTDVKDYIVKPKPNDFMQLKVYAVYSGMGFPLPVECQFMTNYMHSRNALGEAAQHGLYKRQWSSVIDYAIEQKAITREEVDCIRQVVVSALR